VTRFGKGSIQLESD